MADVTLKNIKKVYDKTAVAVQSFHLEIKDKEFVVLVGPSGCGKSTTLRMIAGLEDISEGELYIGGRRVNDVAPKDRDIAMVFQNYALYPHMSVYDNLAFSLKLRRMKKADIDVKVKEAAQILGICDLLKRKPRALSGGQRQRVAIGRAIVREPQAFLMDEPLSNLDAKLRNQMRAEIIKLRDRIDTTFIYVTHDQTEAMTLGDKIVVMKDGWIQQVGTPNEVFCHPANKFVAGFIGSPQMNFFNAKLKPKDGGYAVELLGIKIVLPQSKSEALRRGGNVPENVIIGVRPEHIDVLPENLEGVINAEVEVSEMMGSEIYLHVDLDGHDTVIRVPVLDLPNSGREMSGRLSEISFRFRPDQIHIFDAQTQYNVIGIDRNKKGMA